jgi:hypothetical protein
MALSALPESRKDGLSRNPDKRGLNWDRFELLQETEHFCRWRQEKVAKIVPYAPPLLFKDLPSLIVTWTINLPARQLDGSNSARQLIGSNVFQVFKKVQTTLNSFVNCYPLFFSRTLGNLLVPKRSGNLMVPFFGEITVNIDSYLITSSSYLLWGGV